MRKGLPGGIIGAIVLGALVATQTLSIAYAQRTPTDIELKAAYCLTMNQGMVTALGQLPHDDSATGKYAVNATAEANDRLNRLKLYVVPRLSALEPLALAGAMKRGEVDYETYKRTANDLLSKCSNGCGVNADGSWQEKTASCANSCLARDPLWVRFQSCVDINWLPF